MSLFKAREWWSVRCGDGEEFDSGSLAVGNVDNDPSNAVKLVTGSLQGTLRIYAPRGREAKVDDLLLEAPLDAPILQVAVGRFTSCVAAESVPDSANARLGECQTRRPPESESPRRMGTLALAVLHPRKLTVYNVVGGGGSAGQAAYFSLAKAHEHPLDRAAHSFVHGPFGRGGQNNADYLCVQSLDGQLSAYEHEALAFSRFLGGFLVPGPLAYVAKIDAIVTCSSAMEVESYTYRSLASGGGGGGFAGVSGGNDKDKDPNGVPRARPDWSFTLGEAALAIVPARFSATLASFAVDILVLGERTLVCLSESGEPRFQKRLDYPPCAAWPFRAHVDDTGGPVHNLLIGSATGSLLVYKEARLAWAAKLESPPVAIATAAVGAVQGLVVTLSEAGQLSLSYLGTDPAVNVVGAKDGKELDYEAMDGEHRRLMASIREHTGAARPAAIAEPLLLHAQVPQTLDAGGGAYDDPGRWRVTLKLSASYAGRGPGVDNIRLSVRVPPPLVAARPTVTIPGVRRTPVTVPLQVFAGGTGGGDAAAAERAALLPASAAITVVAAYETPLGGPGGGQPRATAAEFRAPACLLLQVIPVVKAAAFKITIDTNRAPPSLTRLFEDLCSATQSASDLTRASAGNVLSLQYAAGPDVTILVSKNAGRYRLQSDCFEALWLPAEELTRRLDSLFGSDPASQADPSGPYAAGFTEPVPLADYFVLLDAHFAARGEVGRLSTAVDAGASQLRAVQKRLLVRFKDRNPAPLASLDVLLDCSVGQVTSLATQLESANAARRLAANRLACGTRLLLLLLHLRAGLDATGAAVLAGHWPAEVADSSPGFGWEEVVDAGLSHLLRTGLAKPGAREPVAAMGVPAPVADTAMLKRRMAAVVERLVPGVVLGGGARGTPAKGEA